MPDHWHSLLQLDPQLFDPLDANDRRRLLALAGQFIATRHICGAGDLVPGDTMVRRIALQACLPILNLGLDWYASVATVIVYPGSFLVDQQWTDDDGVEHQARVALSGEAWQQGPVVLAWDEIDDPWPGSCVVIHEFCHVLDALNGRVNGFPPIADRELAKRWPVIFSAAFDDHCLRLAEQRPLLLDAYAGEAPEEFFAVASERFFTEPDSLRCGYPSVFDALAAFYRWPPDNRPDSLLPGTV